jgi:hypothetical protein
VLNVLKRYAGRKSISNLTPEEVKAGLLEASKAEAGHKCGNRYKRMIEMCLTSDFGVDDSSDTTLQTEVQVVFRQELLGALREEQEALIIR